MQVVSIINYKGGVGKTTVTANLAAELAWRGKRVLVIDLDSQTSLTFSFIRPEIWMKNFAESKTIKTWFDAMSADGDVALSDLIFSPKDANDRIGRNGQLDLIPSHLGLINVDLELATDLGGATLKKAKANYLRVHQRLAKGLASISDDEYDIILIDCPPNFNVVTKTAIVASDSILIPAKPDYLSTMGIDYLIRSLNQLVTDYNEFAESLDGSDSDTIAPKILGVLFTMVQFYRGQPISATRPFIAQTKKLGVPVMDAMVRENKTLFADAPQYGVPVVLIRHNIDTYRRVVKELEVVVTEFVKAVGL